MSQPAAAPAVVEPPADDHEDVPEEDEEGKKGASKGKGTKRKGKEKKKQGPKRPLSAYMFFCQAMRPDVKKDNPNANFSDLGKLLGQKWQLLKDSEKKPYEKQNAIDKERYEKEKDELNRKEAEDQTTETAEPKAKKPKTTTAAKKEKSKKGPKPPKSAYMLFADDERAKLKTEGKDVTFAESGKHIGERWRALNEKEKQPYVEKNKQLKEEYEKAKTDWEAVNGPMEKKVTKKKGDGKKKKAEGEGGADDDDGDSDGED